MRQLKAIQNLIDEFAKLPSIGRKTAQRLCYYVVDTPGSEASKLAEAIIEVKKQVKYCSRCGGLAEEELCTVCADLARDKSKICVVENVRDYWAIENTGSYDGVYHVLHGALSPIDGIGADDIRIRELLLRISEEDIKEVIIATSPTVPGEATSLYISKLLSKTPDLVVTRIAKGVPMGGELEYADEVTLARAIENRQKLGGN